MRAYWILPNRGQQDDILASDGEKVMQLRQILEPKTRPDGFSHGVPAELLEKCGPQRVAEILFAQSFPDWNGDQRLFLVSSTAGTDSSGRVVHLGLLFILGPHERPRFELPYAALPEKDQSYARALIERLAAGRRGDSWVRSVYELSELSSGSGPATNVELERSVVRFQSRYTVGPGGLTRKAAARSKSRAKPVMLLILIAVLGTWFCERACQHLSPPSIENAAASAPHGP